MSSVEKKYCIFGLSVVELVFHEMLNIVRYLRVLVEIDVVLSLSTCMFISSFNQEKGGSE